MLVIVVIIGIVVVGMVSGGIIKGAIDTVKMYKSKREDGK